MINNNLFKLKEIPNYHPIVDKYERMDFWREEKRKCIEGCWVGGYWMPPELYYYINFHHITMEEGIYRGIHLPWHRDIEWEKARLYAEATGFSGFEMDERYSCNRLLLEDLTDDELLIFCRDSSSNINLLYRGNFFKPDGTRKEYIPTKDYIGRNHGISLGRPIYLNPAKHIMEMAARGLGKDLKYNTLVYGEEKSFPIKDVKLGDKIYGADGKLTTVVQRRDFYNQLQYKLKLSDGRSLECGAGHLWTVLEKTHGGYKRITKSLEEINKDYKIGKRGDARYYIEMNDPIQYPEKQLPIDPYFFGLWLGDGNSHNTGITTMDSEIKNFIYRYAEEWNLQVSVSNQTKTAPVYTICKSGNGDHPNNLKRELHSLNVIGNKHIPDIYLRSSFEQRLALLQGLMDSDGYANPNAGAELTTSYDGLKTTIPSLIYSLGIRCKVTVKKTARKDSLRISLLTTLPIFRLGRKAKIAERIPSKYGISNRSMSAIVSITPTEVAHSVCIAVDNDSKLFIAGDGCIVTHNSYWASACIAHNFLFSGARNYDEYLRLKKMDNPLKTETVVGAVDTKYSYKLVDKVLTALTRLPGSFNMMLERDNVVFPSPLSVATEGSMAVGKTFKAIASGSTIQHVTFADNPLAANGGRPNKIFIDEVGFQKNILETWEAIESTQAAEVFKRLTIYAMGTGGLTSAGAVTYTQEIFTNPDTYNCIAIDDVWENSGKIGYFVSAIKASNKYKEGPNYITNEDKALIDIEKEREKARKSKSKTKLLGLMINKPIKPSEIFLRLDGTFFRAEDLKRVLGELETNRKLLDLSWKVDLEFIKEGIVYPMPSNKRPIRDFPLRRGMDMEGCVELFEKPKKDSTGLIPFRRYIIATDPVDDDENTNIRLSLQSTFVLDTWTDRIVAEYTSRTYFVDDYYENVRRLCMYYNTQCLYENNKKGMYSYFKNKGSLHLLAETPDIMKQQNVVRAEGISNKAVGVNIANEQVKLYAIQRYKKWLETLANTNSEEDEGKQNYQLIRSVGLLKETINYTLDGNYDRVSAMMILMIYRDELALQVQAVKASGNNAENSMTDKFWSRAYKKYVHKPNEVYNRTRKNRYLSLN